MDSERLNDFYYSESELTRGVTSLQWQTPVCHDVDAFYNPNHAQSAYDTPFPPPSSTDQYPARFVPLGHPEPLEQFWSPPAPPSQYYGLTDLLSGMSFDHSTQPSAWTSSEGSTPSPTHPSVIPPVAHKRQTHHQDRFQPYGNRSHYKTGREHIDIPLNTGHDVSQDTLPMASTKALKRVLKMQASASCSEKRRLVKKREVARLRAAYKIREKDSENEVLRQSADIAESCRCHQNEEATGSSEKEDWAFNM